jgi:hypothetical protein
MTEQTHEKGLLKATIEFVGGGVSLTELLMEEWLLYCICTRWNSV